MALPVPATLIKHAIQARASAEMASAAIRHLLDALRDQYRDLPDAVEYLNQAETDAVEHFRQFLRDQDKRPPIFGIPLATEELIVIWDSQSFHQSDPLE